MTHGAGEWPGRKAWKYQVLWVDIRINAARHSAAGERNNKNQQKETKMSRIGFRRKVVATRKMFSLIELLIVIGIMAALTALILPYFTDVETEAKDTACDYNQYGTLRYVKMFNQVNGVYPTGMHTGLPSTTATTAMDSLVDDTEENFETAARTTIEPLTAEERASLNAAGIVSLAYGTDAATAITTATPVVAKVKNTATENWNDDGSDLTIDGKNLREIADATHVIIPLFVATTVDWEQGYEADGTAMKDKSKVQIDLEGKCPWPGAEEFRYYICFFKVATANGANDPAKLVGTACPECGSLNP